MYLGVLHALAPVLGAEKSKVPFYFAGGVLVVWAVVLSLGFGMRSERFPGSVGGQWAVIAITAVLVVVAAATAVISSGGTSTPAAAATTPGSVASAKSAPAPSSPAPAAVSTVAGTKIFKEICSTCHTLAAADATGKVGPNLDQLKPDKALVEHQVTYGGGGMPAFGSQFSSSQIESVAEYVSTVAGKAAG